jgi:hypothetical protein
MAAAHGFSDMAVWVDGEQRTGRRCGGRTSEWSIGRRSLAVDGALRLGRRRHRGFGSLRVVGKGVRRGGEREVSVVVGGAGKGGGVAVVPAKERRRGWTEQRSDRAVGSTLWSGRSAPLWRMRDGSAALGIQSGRSVWRLSR